jgi:hypothetical protein
MSQVHFSPIDIRDAVEGESLKLLPGVRGLLITFTTIGFLTIMFAYVMQPPEIFWGSYFINSVFWMGLAAGSVALTAILQIVRGIWAAPMRRILEANVAFLPWALVLMLMTYFGKEHLFPWGRGPMPGKEAWMQPDFVYGRMAIILGLLFFLMNRYVRMGLRGDIGLIRETPSHAKRWDSYIYDALAKGWQGAKLEIPAIQNRMSFKAPIIIACYAVIYSLFSFDMIMSMDLIWYSNMYGGFTFMGNIYLALAVLNIMTFFLTRSRSQFDTIISKQQRWDLGKLTCGFCMFWGYTFFSQFLPQWYGNVPEETQWMILRTREYPWKALGWITLSVCFILPFTLLFSEDIKKVRNTFACVGVLSIIGLWLEKYMVIMPQLSPTSIPLGFVDIGIFLGFLGIYGMSVLGFLDKYPYIFVSSPMTKAQSKW